MFDNMVVYVNSAISPDRLLGTSSSSGNIQEIVIGTGVNNAEIPFSTICSQENTEAEATEELSGWES